MVCGDDEYPEQLLEALPEGRTLDRDTLLEMAYTACVIGKEGESFEFRLKIHPESYRLPFLDQTDPLHRCYKLLKRNEGNILDKLVQKHAPDVIQGLFLGVTCQNREAPLDTSCSDTSGNDNDSGSPEVPLNENSAIIQGYPDSE